jgi:hypothetical protein
MAIPGTPVLLSVCFVNFSNSIKAVLTSSEVTVPFGLGSSPLAIVASTKRSSVQREVFMATRKWVVVKEEYAFSIVPFGQPEHKREQRAEVTELTRSGAQKSKLCVGVNQHGEHVTVGISAGNLRFLESALLGYPNVTPTLRGDRLQA